MFVSALLLTSGTLFLGSRITRRPAPSPLVKLMRKADPRATSSPLSSAAEGSWQLQEFNPEQQAELQKAEHQLNRHFLVATTGMAIAVTGLVTHTALGPFSILFTLYTCMPLVQTVYQGIVEERRLRGPIIDLVAVGTALAAHYYVLCAASCALMCVAEKIVYRTQDRSRQRMISVFHQQRQLAWVVRSGVEVEVPLAELQVGDGLVVGAGGVIPVDGVITPWAATVDLLPTLGAGALTLARLGRMSAEQR